MSLTAPTLAQAFELLAKALTKADPELPVTAEELHKDWFRSGINKEGKRIVQFECGHYLIFFNKNGKLVYKERGDQFEEKDGAHEMEKLADYTFHNN